MVTVKAVNAPMAAFCHMAGHKASLMPGHVAGHVAGHMAGHIAGHMAGHVAIWPAKWPAILPAIAREILRVWNIPPRCDCCVSLLRFAKNVSQ